MPVTTSIFAAAWAAGVVEGASVIANAQEKSKKGGGGLKLIVPAVLYGTISLPLSLIGAAPGPTMIGYLPFTPKIMDALQQQPPPPPPIRSVAPTAVEPMESAIKFEKHGKKDKRRVDLLREENRSRTLAATRPPLAPPPPRQRPTPTTISATTTTRYLATLDAGQAALLPTPVAEAMRRTRFLLVGAGLVTMILRYQANQEELKRQVEEEILEKKRSGKDISAIQQLLLVSTTSSGSSKHSGGGGGGGAVVRWCDSLHQVSSSSSANNNNNNNKSAFATTIPLYNSSYSNAAAATPPDEPYWNPGSQPDEWNTTPISSDWLMHTKIMSRLLVLEADITPYSLEQYFVKNPQNNTLSKAVLLFDSLVATATKKGVLASPSEAVKVVLGCSSGKPALSLSDTTTTIYLDTHNGLGVQVNSILERMHTEVVVEAEFAAKKKKKTGTHKTNEKTGSTSAAAPKQQHTSAPMIASLLSGKKTTPQEYLQVVVNETITLVDTVGSSIRQTAAWTVEYLQEIHNINFRSHRVVHVLSDQRHFVQFLQQSLRDWRIVWYDANKESDVELYRNNGDAAISVVCCGNDVTTSAFLAATTTTMTTTTTGMPPRILAIVEQPTALVPSGVSTISIQEVHNNLFSHVRDLLSDGKTPEEVQELVDFIR